MTSRIMEMKNKTKSTIKNETLNFIFSNVFNIMAISVMLIYGIYGSKEISKYIIDGIKLSVFTVLPSAFPFMIISDLYMSYGEPEKISILEKPFRQIFCLSKSSLTPFICGNIGGFPQGTKIISQMYKSMALKKEEAENLLPLCNNPSAPFVVFTVGTALFNNKIIGTSLLLSLYLSNTLCGILLRNKRYKNSNCEYKIKQKFDLVSSIRSAGHNCVDISSFIIFFSALCGIINTCNFPSKIKGVLFAFLEVTNGVNLFSNSDFYSVSAGVFLSGFCLGFGGLSALIQSMSLAKDTDLSFKKYIFFKLIQGLLCAFLSLTFFHIL